VSWVFDSVEEAAALSHYLTLQCFVAADLFGRLGSIHVLEDCLAFFFLSFF
jgi:hypothetical protein